MPWCEDCARYLTPTSLTEAGECPSCGRLLGEPPTTPWHFKLLMLAAAVYLGWRFVQGMAWLLHQL
jgi:hypothetical protein